MKNKKNIWLFIVLLIIFTLIASIILYFFSFEKAANTLDMSRLYKQKVLCVSLSANSSDYFIDNGRPTGFQLELLEKFAKHLGVKLKVYASHNIEEQIEWLKEEKTDICAANLAISKKRSRTMLHSRPIYETGTRLVQRAKNEENQFTSFVKSLPELHEKNIVVPKASIYKDLLKNIAKQHHININVISDEECTEEELLKKVLQGDIDYSLVSENMAKRYSKIKNNLDYHLRIGRNQQIAWFFHPSADSLKTIADNWLEIYSKTPEFAFLYQKYYILHRYKKPSEKISKYDKIIREYSQTIAWDWRLLASLIYQESKFKENLESRAGAFGLMQLMPQTAETFGLLPQSEAKEHIKAGVKFIQWLDKNLPPEITDKKERICFILASYNIGPGHILDARRLCKKGGGDPNKWLSETENYILLKSKAEYQNDSCIRNGYAKGEETYRFVREILSRYYHYCNLIQTKDSISEEFRAIY